LASKTTDCVKKKVAQGICWTKSAYEKHMTGAGTQEQFCRFELGFIASSFQTPCRNQMKRPEHIVEDILFLNGFV